MGREGGGQTGGYGNTVIRFSTYNIRNGRNGVLDSALMGMKQANVDLGVLQKTKVADGIHTHASADFHILADNAPSRHRGGITVFYQNTPHFRVKYYQPHGPNVASFQVASGSRRWFVIR